MSEIYSFCPKSRKREVVKNKIEKSNGASFIQNAKKTKKNTKPVEVSKKTPDINLHEKKCISVNDYNIFHIDSIIKDTLLTEIENIDILYKELDIAIKISNNGSYKDKAIAKKRILILRNKIKNIENTNSLSYYIFRTFDIIESYRKTTATNNARSFVCFNKDKDVSDKEINQKSELLSKFISIAREYIDIEDYHQIAKKLTCPTCGNTDMRRVSDEDTTFLCSLCSTEIQILDDTPSFKDTDRINMCNRYTYSRKGHFIDSIKKHQGKQNTDPVVIKNVIDVLLKEMELHNLSIENVTKHHLYMFLSEKELSSHYDDLNLIYHMITNKPCPDISMYEQRLLEDFDTQEKALVEVYEMDTNNTRLNSLNVYYKLYKLLQRCGYPCRKDDFYILKTKTKEDEHDEKMENAWKRLDWVWIDTF